MSARGVDFLELWIDGNVLPGPADRIQARKLAQKLAIDAAAAGFTLADLDLEPGEVEKYIMDKLVHVGEPPAPID